MFVNGKDPAFTDGAQITAEDKAIVRTGGAVFTSSPTASTAGNFHQTAFLISIKTKLGLLGI